MNKDILLPLRRIHGQFHEWRIKRKEAKQLRRMIGNASKPVALIVGTPDHENIGDSAIACAEAAFLQKMGFDTVEITTNEYRLNPMLLSAAVEKELPDVAPNFVRCSREEIYDLQENIFR